MFSERERRALEEIELRLARESPRLAAELRHPPRRARRQWSRLGLDLAISFSVLLAVLCFVLSTATTVGAAFVVAGLAVLLAVVRNHQHPYSRRRRRPRSP